MLTWAKSFLTQTWKYKTLASPGIFRTSIGKTVSFQPDLTLKLSLGTLKIILMSRPQARSINQSTFLGGESRVSTGWFVFCCCYFECVRVYACVRVRAHVCVLVPRDVYGARGQPQVSFLRSCPLCFLKQSLSLGLNLPGRVDLTRNTLD